MNVDLDFVFVVLELAKDGEDRADCDILFGEPVSEVALPARPAGSLVAVIIEPQDACHHTRGVIDAKEEAVLLPDLEDDRACDLHLCEEELIAEQEEELAARLVVLSLVFPVQRLVVALLDQLVLLV